jgi:hypothetical protein
MLYYQEKKTMPALGWQLLCYLPPMDGACMDRHDQVWHAVMAGMLAASYCLIKAVLINCSHPIMSSPTRWLAAHFQQEGSN